MSLPPTLLCRGLASPFTDLEKRERRIFLTLGPEGTSSKLAAEHAAALLGGRIALFNTYEAAARGVRDDPHNRALIVANAYAEINRFYISTDLSPFAAFFYDTPEYVIASRSGTASRDAMASIATHPAPRHLIAPAFQRSNMAIVETVSTHEAAAMAARGDVDACLTTRTAADLLGLEMVASVMATIPMLWTIFTSKDCAR